MVGNAHHGVHGTYARLAESLRSYLEAQYHIRNEAAIQERRLLFWRRPVPFARRHTSSPTPVL